MDDSYVRSSNDCDVVILSREFCNMGIFFGIFCKVLEKGFLGVSAFWPAFFFWLAEEEGNASCTL